MNYQGFLIERVGVNRYVVSRCGKIYASHSNIKRCKEWIFEHTTFINQR